MDKGGYKRSCVQQLLQSATEILTGSKSVVSISHSYYFNIKVVCTYYWHCEYTTCIKLVRFKGIVTSVFPRR